MPISKSAKKALRVNRRKTALNRYRKALVKDALKNVDEKSVSTTVSMIASDRTERLSRAFSAIDKAAKWRLIHKNKAARLKSNLAKRFSGKATTDGKVKTKKVVKKTTAKSKTKKS